MEEKRQEVTIVNELGMHARAAARFVKLASTFKSTVEIEKDDQRVNGKSIMGILMLAASRGTTLTIIATGEDADNAIESLVKLVSDGLSDG